MSAWIVSKKHIDLMVAGVVEGSRDGVLPPHPAPRGMEWDPDRLGQMLVSECVASVSHRYPNDDVGKGELPGPCDLYYLQPYVWADPIYRPTAAEMAKAVSCYQYQSCEHPGWLESNAREWCETVLGMISSKVPAYARMRRTEDARSTERNAWPAYEAAPWGFHEEEVALCFAQADPDGRRLLAAAKAAPDALPALSDWLSERGLLSAPLDPKDGAFLLSQFAVS